MNVDFVILLSSKYYMNLLNERRIVNNFHKFYVRKCLRSPINSMNVDFVILLGISIKY